MTYRAAVLGVALAILGAAAPAFSGVRAFSARHRPAAELAGLLTLALGRAAPVNVIADEKSDRVLVEGPAAALGDAMRALAELDVVPQRFVLLIELTAGPPGATRPVWRARQRVIGGMTARARVERMKSLLPGAPLLGRVNSALTVTGIEGGVDVRGSVELDLASGPQVVISGQARAEPGKPVQLGEVQTAGDGAVGLTVTVSFDDPRTSK